MVSTNILFISTLSQKCIGCLKYSQQYRLPIRIVRLDTADSRSKASNGKYFQIKVVPALVIHHADGNTQLFVGVDKVMAVMTSIKDELTTTATINYSPGRPGPSMYDQEFHSPPTKPRYEARPTKPRYQGHASLREIRQEQTHIDPNNFSPNDADDSQSDNDSDHQTWESGPHGHDEDTNPIPPPKQARNIVVSKKRPPVIFEEEDSIEDVEIPVLKSNDRYDKGPPQSRMQEIIDKAKSLEQDRLSSLGYNEEDLPHYQ